MSAAGLLPQNSLRRSPHNFKRTLSGFRAGDDTVSIGIADQSGNSVQFFDCSRLRGGHGTDGLDVILVDDVIGDGNLVRCTPQMRGFENS